MKHIHVLLGKTLSGKSHMQKELKDFYVEPIITTTTRPKRVNEKNHTNYNFVDKTTFENDQKNNHAICIREYNVTNNDIWSYYLNTEQLNELSNQNSIILDYEGFKDLKDYIIYHKLDNIRLHAWYLDIDLKTRLDRHFRYRSNEDEVELLRRLYSDELAFKHILDDPDIKPIKSMNDIITTIYYLALNNKKG